MQYETSKKQNASRELTENQLNKQIQSPSINYNGFASTPTLLQTLPILYTITMLAQFILQLIEVHSQRVMIPVILFYLIACIIASILWYLTTKIDPTDSIQIKHRKAIQNSEDLNANQYKYFCHLCQTCVSKNAFHCKKCNRCVQMFDHHCKWLNNCIGAKNYFEFFYLICATEFLLAYHLIANIVLLAWQASNEAEQAKKWVFYFCIVMICLDFIIFCFNSVLVAMHIYLITQKKSTIELIREMRGYNRIHPSKQKNQGNASKKQEISRESDSAQDWKINIKGQRREKIEELILPSQKSKSISIGDRVENKKEFDLILIKENLRKAPSKLAPIKLAKFPNQSQ